MMGEFSESSQNFRKFDGMYPRDMTVLMAGEVTFQFSIGSDGRRHLQDPSGGLHKLLLAAPDTAMEAELFFDLIHCEDRGPFEDALDESRQMLTPLDCRFRQYTAEGDLRQVLLRAVPRRPGDDSVVWDSVVQEITEELALEAIRYSIPANPSGSGRRTRLDRVDVSAILKDLERLFEEERAYRDEEICLEELARRLRVTPHALSELLNRRLGVTYYEYVSRWRVAEACRLLCESAPRTILQIGFDSGFRSKVAFHEAFRRFTGLSPGEYRRKKRVQDRLEIRGELLDRPSRSVLNPQLL